MVASRLVEYEVWTRLNARGLGARHGNAASAVLARFDFVELSPAVLGRTLEPFPVPLRTLDALHLASIEYLRGQRAGIELASYDERMLAGARALGVRVYAI